MLIGIDEAGRGPVLGPLVVGICAVPDDAEPLLVSMGVKDSKDLSSKQRQHIETWFLEQCETKGWFGATVVIQPERIDRALQQQGLNWLEVEGFQEALRQVPHQRDLTIVADACDVNAERFTQRITAGLDGWPYPQSTMISNTKPTSGTRWWAWQAFSPRKNETVESRRCQRGSGSMSVPAIHPILQQRRRCRRWWNNAALTPRFVGDGRPSSVFGMSIAKATCRFEAFNVRRSSGCSIHDASRIS